MYEPSLTTALVVFHLLGRAVLKSLWLCFGEEGIQNYCIYSIQFTCTLSTKHIHYKTRPSNWLQGVSRAERSSKTGNIFVQVVTIHEKLKVLLPILQADEQHVAQKISVQNPRVKTLYLFIRITHLRPKIMSYKSLLVTKIISYFKSQCAKKFVSNSLRLVDCAIGLVNSVLN